MEFPIRIRPSTPTCGVGIAQVTSTRTCVWIWPCYYFYYYFLLVSLFLLLSLSSSSYFILSSSSSSHFINNNTNSVLQLHTARRSLMLMNTTRAAVFYRICKVAFSRLNHVIGIHPTAWAGLLLSCIVDSEMGQSWRLNCLRDPDAKSGCQRRVGHVV